MLKGLEVSEVKFSELENEIRLDAELYDKNYVLFKSAVKRIPYTTFADECSVIKKGIFDINSSCYCDEGIPFVRISNLKEMKIDTTDIVHIPIFEHRRNYKTELKRDDIVLSKTAIPAASIVNLDCCNVSQDTVAIKLKSDSKLLSHYVVVFLNTKYGLEQMKRRFTGNIQMHLNLEECKNEVLIPVFDRPFQEKIKTYFLRSIDLSEKSKSLYAEAEDILLSELCLKDWQPKNEAVSIKTFSDFASSGRLDAEFYQSKYDELFEKLSKFPQIKIKDIINYPVSSGSTPKAGDSEYYSDEKTGIPFLRAVDIIQSRIDLNDLMYIKSRVHNGLLKRTQLHKGDVLFSIAGTVGRCGIFDYDFEANINQAIAILRFDESVVKHLYVIQFFNSKIGQLVIEKYARQGLQTNLNLEELSDLPIPILPQETQKQIAELIQTSFALRQESKQLLESAKLAVEAEIESAN